MSANPFEGRFDDGGPPRPFREDYALSEEVATVTATVVAERLAADPDASLVMLMSAALEAARERGLPEIPALEAVTEGVDRAIRTPDEFPADLKHQLESLAEELGHSEVADHVLDEAFLTGCDALRQTPKVRSHWFSQAVVRGMRRGLSLPEALAIVRAGFVEAAEEAGR